MPMRAKLKRLSIWLLGWGFIILGILGLFLPILQGILFLIIGLALLSNSSPWAARLLIRLRDRFPAVSRKFDEAMIKTKEVQARVFKKKPREAEDPK